MWLGSVCSQDHEEVHSMAQESVYGLSKKSVHYGWSQGSNWSWDQKFGLVLLPVQLWLLFPSLSLERPAGAWRLGSIGRREAGIVQDPLS